MNLTLLIVDDDRGFRSLTEVALAAEGFEVRQAATLARARSELAQAAPDVVLLDRRLPDGDGLDLLTELHATDPEGPLVIVVTAYGDVESAVTALRAGAVDYLIKPLQVADLIVKLRRAIETRRLRDQLAYATGALRHPVQPAVGSAAAQRVQRELEQVATSPLTPVLLSGPSGAGKQYAAEALHRLTYPDHASAPFVDLNCAALPEHLLESELFGHERGAFTDAKTTRRGLVELASGGTLFLDEVSELPEHAQAKLLKFFDSMKIRRVGGQRELSVTLRVVLATHRPLDKLVEQGRFRADLYHRITVYQVRIPALSERREDLPVLADTFLRFFGARVKKSVRGLTPGAHAALARYAFPGNVRELRNMIERGVIRTTTEWVTEAELGLEEAGPSDAQAGAFFSVSLQPDGSPPPLSAVERRYTAHVLAHLGGPRAQAAQALGISYPTLLKYLRESGVEPE